MTEWADEDVQLLASMADRGFSAAQTATVLGTTRAATLGKAWRSGIQFCSGPEVHKRQVRLGMKGLTMSTVTPRVRKMLGAPRGVPRETAAGAGSEPKGRVSQTISSRTGSDLSDPNRADRLLRRWSWEKDEQS